MPAIDVTDQTFQSEVVDRSAEVPVVVDLWATWCGPCQTLGPIIEKVVDATGGQVVLVKVDVDQSPGVAQAFQVQSIPAVYALKDGKVVDGFVGAQPEQKVQEFVDGLLPSEEENTVRFLIDQGTDEALREAITIEPTNAEAITALAALRSVGDDAAREEALALLAKIPETDETRRIAARARADAGATSDAEHTFETLLAKVKTDEAAKQEYLDLLELLGPDDPRTAEYRRRLSAALF